MSGEYVEWLEERVKKLEVQVETWRIANINLRNKLMNQREEANRRFRDDYDHVEYPDDDYDR